MAICNHAHILHVVTLMLSANLNCTSEVNYQWNHLLQLCELNMLWFCVFQMDVTKKFTEYPLKLSSIRDLALNYLGCFLLLFFYSFIS